VTLWCSLVHGPLRAEVCDAKHKALEAMLSERHKEQQDLEVRVAELEHELVVAAEHSDQLEAQLAEQKEDAAALSKKWQAAQRMLDDRDDKEDGEDICKPWPVGIDQDAISGITSMQPVRLEEKL
jgi:chromosome segregation ATPase